MAAVNVQVTHLATSSTAVVLFYTYDGANTAEVRVPVNLVMNPNAIEVTQLDNDFTYVAVAFDAFNIPRATIAYRPRANDSLKITQINNFVWQIGL